MLPVLPSPPRALKVRYGALPRAQLLPSNHRALLAMLAGEGIPIPSLDPAKLAAGDYHVILEASAIEVEFAGGAVLRWEIRRGWITDLASVPHRLRSAVDNDAGCIVAAALVHDSIFESQPWGASWGDFSDANSLFRSMILEQGGGEGTASLAWISVQVGAWLVWLDITDSDREYGRAMVQVVAPRAPAQGNASHEDGIERARRLAGGPR